MNESQQVASLAGIPMDQVKEFARQYIELAMVGNTITLWISGIVFVLCAIGFSSVFKTRNYLGKKDGLYTLYFWIGVIALIVLASSGWDRYKMTHYPIPYIIQDLRDSNK